MRSGTHTAKTRDISCFGDLRHALPGGETEHVKVAICPRGNVHTVEDAIAGAAGSTVTMSVLGLANQRGPPGDAVEDRQAKTETGEREPSI
jgi:hypothetical protein